MSLNEASVAMAANIDAALKFDQAELGQLRAAVENAIGAGSLAMISLAVDALRLAQAAPSEQ